MTTATIAGKEIHVDDEGFLTDHTEWNEDVAGQLAANIGLELSDAHWSVLKFVRTDYEVRGETPTLRRVANESGTPTKALFTLFPKKPAKKMSYVAGVPKPVGCV